MLRMLLLGVLVLAYTNYVSGNWGCFQVTGLVTCGAKEYVPAVVRLLDNDIIREKQMIAEFGFGNINGPTQIIRKDDILFMEGCSWDLWFGKPDPYLRISSYSCGGKRKLFGVEVDRDKCKYNGSQKRLKNNSDGTIYDVHMYLCRNIKVDLLNENIIQGKTT